MTVEIPVRADLARYSMRVELDAVLYELSFEWNERIASWLMSIATEAGDPIVLNVKLSVTLDLLGDFSDSRLPPGLLLAVDTTGKDLDPAFDDLGNRVQLVYTPAGEIAEIVG